MHEEAATDQEALTEEDKKLDAVAAAATHNALDTWLQMPAILGFFFFCHLYPSQTCLYFPPRPLHLFLCPLPSSLLLELVLSEAVAEDRPP